MPTLNEKTPRSEQARILAVVKRVAGVSRAILHPHAHQVEVVGKDASEPNREDIASAVAKIGFPLGERVA